MKPSRNIRFQPLVNLLVSLLFLSPLLPLKVSAILLVLLGLSTIFLAIKYRNELVWPKKIPWFFFLFISLGLIYLIYFPFSANSSEAWFHFEKRMALIIVPFLAILWTALGLQFNRKSIEGIYVFGNLILAGASILAFLYSELFFFQGIGDYSYWYRTMLEDFTGLHPTYLALHLNAAFILLMLQYSWNDFSLKKAPSLLALAVLLLGSFLSGARSPLIALVVASTVLLFQSKQLSLKLKGIGLACIGSGVFLLYQIPIMKSRVQGLIDVFQMNLSSNQAIESSQRFLVLFCDLGLIKKFGLWGVGTGQVQEYLNGCYLLMSFYQPLNQQLNTHNEFFNIWLGTGIIGITLMIAFFVSAWKTLRSIESRGLLLLFGMVCMTENLLERQQGVFFLALWFSLFFYEYLNKESVAPEEVEGR